MTGRSECPTSAPASQIHARICCNRSRKSASQAPVVPMRQ
jgi:hypothetical protein